MPQLDDHGLCVRSEQTVCVGAVLPVAISTKTAGNVNFHGVVGRGRYCKRGMRLAVKAKAGVVFRLSETVRVQSMVGSHDFVRSQVCCGRVLQRTDEREPAPGVCNGALSL
jgi:hypothetical protein